MSGKVADLWNVLLGLAVVVLTGVSAFGLMETRRLTERVSRLEGGAPAGVDDAVVPSPAPQNIDRQFTKLNTPVSTRDSAFKGDPAAAVVVVEFSDFECPFCAKHVRDTFRRINEKYITTGKIKYVFRHLPLEDIHPQAFRAAELAECGRRQGRFWELHDQFFTTQRMLKERNLRKVAIATGLEPSRLDECLTGSARDQVLRDLADARALGAVGTPLFFIGRASANGTVQATHSINGARPFQVFQAVLDQLLGNIQVN